MYSQGILLISRCVATEIQIASLGLVSLACRKEELAGPHHMIYSMTVTGFVKRDHLLHFEKHMLQRYVFPQQYAQSKFNMEALYRRHYCSTQHTRNEVFRPH